MAFKTGRTVTLTRGGACQASTARSGHPTLAPLSLAGHDGDFTISALGASFALSLSEGTISGGGGVSPPFRNFVQGALSLGTPLGSASDSFGPIYVDAPGRAERTSSGGSWSVTMDCEEWAEIESGPGYPAFGGAAQEDGRKLTVLNLWLVGKPGGTYAASCSVAGLSVSVSGVIPPGGLSVDHGISSTSEAGAEREGATTYVAHGFGGVTQGVDFSGSRTITPPPFPPGLPTGNLSWTTGSGTSASASGAGRIACSLSNRPDARYTVALRLRRMGTDYGGSLPAKVRMREGEPPGDLSAPGSVTWGQRVHSCSAYVQSTTETITGPTAAEVCPVYAWLDGPGLTAAGEDERDRRLEGRGWLVPNAVRLARASSVEIVGAASGTGPGTISVPASFRAVELYRYLRVRWRRLGTDGPGKITLADGYEHAEAMTADAWRETTFDLARPMPGDSDARQWRYPLASPGGFPTATPPAVNRTAGWGLSTLPSVGIETPGEAWEVAWGRLVADAPREISALPAFLTFSGGWTSPSDTTDLKPFLRFQPDGRGPVDLPYMAVVTPEDAPAFERRYSIAEIANMLAALTGGVAEVAPSSAWPPAFGPSDEALLIGALGATYDHGGGGWSDWVDRTDERLPAQFLFDAVEAYPGCGDPFGGSGGAFPLRCSKILRGRAEGNRYREDERTPEPGRTFVARRVSDSAFAGSGSSDGRGFWRTGAPFGVGDGDHRVGAYPPARWQNRLVRWGGLPETPTSGSGLDYDVSVARRHLRAWAEDGTGRLGIGTNLVPASWSDRTLDLPAEDLRADFLRDRRGGIALLSRDGSTWSAARTYDDGRTITMPTAIGSGTQGAQCVLPDGRILALVRSESGPLIGKVLNPDGSVSRDLTTDLTLADEPFAVAASTSPDGRRLRLHVLGFDGSTRRVWTAEDLEHYA